jgi:hypothetical protein
MGDPNFCEAMTLEKTQQVDMAVLLMNPEGTLLFCQVKDLIII